MTTEATVQEFERFGGIPNHHRGHKMMPAAIEEISRLLVGNGIIGLKGAEEAPRGIGSDDLHNGVKLPGTRTRVNLIKHRKRTFQELENSPIPSKGPQRCFPLAKPEPFGKKPATHEIKNQN